MVFNFESYSFIHEFLFPDVIENTRNWIELHEDTKKLLLQKYWRSDIKALQRIDRLLNEFNSTLLLLGNELQKQSNHDIQKLNDDNRASSQFFVLLGIMFLFLLIILYLYIDRNILLPISRTTRALLLQSKGQSQELTIQSNTSESRELLDAFNKMSDQISQRETRLDFIAHHDNLTSLPNRLLFNERLDHAIELTQRSNKQVALMLLDLDRFKLVNDTLGHLFGDKLLQQTSDRLKNCIRKEDTIARLGGDEFAIILENISSKDEVEKFARKIIRLFEDPFYIESQEIHASTSIGIALAPINTHKPTTLTRYADIAMYQSKNMGRNQYTWFTEDLEDSEDSVINFENLLREAIQHDQFEIHLYR